MSDYSTSIDVDIGFETTGACGFASIEFSRIRVNWRTTMPRNSLTNLRDEMRAVARGERMPSPRPAASVLTALTEETLELLNAIAIHPTLTVSGLAQQLDKAQSNVSRSLQRLAGHGLVRLVRQGREVRPQLVSTELKVDLVNRTVCAVGPRRSAG